MSIPDGKGGHLSETKLAGSYQPSMKQACERLMAKQKVKMTPDVGPSDPDPRAELTHYRIELLRWLTLHPSVSFISITMIPSLGQMRVSLLWTTQPGGMVHYDLHLDALQSQKAWLWDYFDEKLRPEAFSKGGHQPKPSTPI